MDAKKYTPEDFKAMKKSLKLTNKDVAEIIGTTEQNVKFQTNKNRPLGTWAKAFVYMYNRLYLE